MLELHSVAETVTVGGLDVTFVSSVVFGRRAKVPTIDGVESPGPSSVRLLVHLDIASHGSERHFVVIEGAIEVCICGDCRSSVGLS
jgi:hypothetical protein